MLTKGGIPYGHIASEVAVFKSMLDNHLPPEPEEIKHSVFYRQLWGVCKMCWRRDPKERPTAEEIKRLMEGLVRAVESQLEED